MKGDFSKLTFNPDKNFLRVMQQQGRVQLDSDWNEQAAILLHYMQTLAADLIGPYAGPEGDFGFECVTQNGKPFNADPLDFFIGKGRYYVGGVLCENHKNFTYLTQPDYPNPSEILEEGNSYLVYLDVWEQHISYLEDDDIREKALNGVDTSTRSKIIWQVKAKQIFPPVGEKYWAQYPERELTKDKRVLALSEACLRAWVEPDTAISDACCQHPEAKYRGAENQLYRVELHKVNDNGSFTFKWSRENGSVVFSVTNIIPGDKTITVELDNLGRDDKLSLAVNDWVELVDDDSVLKNIAYPLLQVHAIDPMARTVELIVTIPRVDPLIYDESKHQMLRRWDQKDVDANGVPVTSPSAIKIEAGIKVEFELHGSKALRTGDYWLIPVRANTGKIEWLASETGFIRPHGTEHHYAPLAIINVSEDKVVTLTADLRCKFKPSIVEPYSTYAGRGQLGIGTDLLCHPHPDDEQ